MYRAAHNPGLALVLAFLVLVPAGTEAQRIGLTASMSAPGQLVLSFITETNYYDVLRRAEEPTGTFAPTAMLLPIGTNGAFRVAMTPGNGFFRVHTVPLTAPEDADLDGLDDVYELRHSPELNPLDKSDAELDHDGDGLTYLEEYRGRMFDEGARRIGVGESHFLALQPDGTLWACGSNRSGQLGDGTTNSSLELIQIEPGSQWLAVAAGGARSYAIKSDGSLWGWGESRYAAMGDGITTNRWKPALIEQGADWRSLAASANHVMAIKQDGSLWAWGVNTSGQLGDGTRTQRPTPVRIGTDNDWASVGVGQNLSLALKRDGRLFAAGDNEWGQLGIGVTNSPVDVLTPVSPGMTWQAIGPGDFHGLAVRSDHTLWAWGQLFEDSGSGFVTVSNHWEPVQIGTNANWLRVAGGYQHSVALASDGSLWAFGYNAFGEVGEGTRLPRTAPYRIAPGNHWLALSTKGLNHVGIRNDGTLWNWSGKGGQFLTTTEMFSPVMPGTKFQAIAAGENHSLAIDESGSIWGWGENDDGQLGDGTTDPGLPRKISTNLVCAKISAGAKHSVAIDALNRVWIWGWLAPGYGASPNPYLASSGEGEPVAWRELASGGWHWLALDGERRLRWLGEQTHGQLPDASASTNSFTAIGAGAWSSLAVDGSGSLYIWGNFSTSPAPTYSGKVPTPGFAFQRVTGGAMHALALCEDGTLWAMGDNRWGQLGTGTNSYPGLLKPVMTNATWRTASAYYHNLAIRSDGTLWFWGYDGNRAITRAPEQVSTNTTWTAVATGYKHSLALRGDGSLWASGDDTYGQTGLSRFRQYGVGGRWRPPTPQ